jgi:hypothetical protein
MEQPEKLPGTRLCIAVRKEGATLYGNPAALRSLAQHLLWIADADPAEHYECHATWELESDACRFDGERPLNAWTLAEPALADILAKLREAVVDGEPALEGGFEVTFMAVEGSDLDELARHQESGVLPG